MLEEARRKAAMLEKQTGEDKIWPGDVLSWKKYGDSPSQNRDLITENRELSIKHLDMANMPIDSCRKVLVGVSALSNRPAGDREDAGPNQGAHGTGEVQCLLDKKRRIAA